MPRSRNDIYKRRSAQAINHITEAVLDINDIYQPFLQQHPEGAEKIKKIMMGLAIAREQMLTFIKESWLLDEESIKVYLGK